MTIEAGEGLADTIVDAENAGQEIPNQEAETETEVKTEGETEQKTENPKVQDEPFPKKAINALNKRERQIGKLRAQNAYMEQRLRELEGKVNASSEQNRPQDNKHGAPSPDDFDNYGDYLEAKTRWAIREEMAAGNKQNQEQQKTQQDFAQQKAWAENSVKVMSEEVDRLEAEYPDMEEVTADFQEILEEGLLPPHLGAALLHAGKDAVMAVYNICKEGRLDQFLRMNPTQAAIELGRASRAPVSGGQKKVSAAPPPLKGASGTGSGQKSLNQMNSKELLEWVKK